MNCPRCASELTEQKASDGSRLLCINCGGFWIDPEPLANSLRKRGISLPEATGAAGNLRCPRDGAGLTTFSFSGVELDRCTQCGGLWLDKGEWERVTGSKSWLGTGMPAAGAVGAAVVGGVAIAAVASAMQQPQHQEDVNRAAGVAGDAVGTGGGFVGEVAGNVACGFLECLCEIVSCIDL